MQLHSKAMDSDINFITMTSAGTGSLLQSEYYWSIVCSTIIIMNILLNVLYLYKWMLDLSRVYHYLIYEKTVNYNETV